MSSSLSHHNINSLSKLIEILRAFLSTPTENGFSQHLPHSVETRKIQSNKCIRLRSVLKMLLSLNKYSLFYDLLILVWFLFSVNSAETLTSKQVWDTWLWWTEFCKSVSFCFYIKKDNESFQISGMWWKLNKTEHTKPSAHLEYTNVH